MLFDSIFEQSSVSVSHEVFVGSDVFKLVDQVEVWSVGTSVNGVLAIDDLGKSVGSGWVSRVVDVDVVSAVAVGQNPVTSVMDVADDDFTGVKLGFDLAVWNLSFVSQTEFADGTPNEQVSADVTSIALEPGIEGAWIVIVSGSGETHGNRWHGTTSFTDGVGWGSKLFISPSGVTLLVHWVSSAQNNSHKKDKG